MPVPDIAYLRWAKTHPRARYELTLSGIAPVTLEDAGLATDDWSIVIDGVYGLPELVSLIAERYNVGPDQVLPVTGTSTANFVALACSTERSRCVAVEAPAYEPLLRAAEFLGLSVVRFRRDPEHRFAPDPDEIEQRLREGAGAVLLSDLHNPSGCRCPQDVLDRTAELCAAYSATLIVDEVYRDFAHLNRDVPRTTAATLGPHVVTTSSLTKVYGFGGLRAGWILADPAFIERSRSAFDHLSVDLPAPSASAAVQVLRRIDTFASRTRAIYRHRYPVFSQWLESRQDLRGYGNDGAVFAYLRLPAGVRSDAFCHFLRREFDTQVVPGAFFGGPDHIRLGFGAPPDTLTEGLRRLGVALDRFDPPPPE